MSLKLDDLVAPTSFAPREWQSAAPPALYLRAPVARSHELDRVMALPRRSVELDGTDRAEAIIDVETERYARPNASCRCAEINPERHAIEGCITRFRLLQALALRELAIVGGLLGPIGVGHGKTMLDLLAPLAFQRHAIAHGMPNAHNLLCVLLVPPGLVTQLVADYDYVGQHFRMPSMLIQGAPEELQRLRPPGENAPRLQVMPYSRIMRSESATWLKVVAPHALIADECHKLRDRKTTTTKRVMAYMDANPQTRFAAWSGSMTSKSIRDYAHLSALTLRAGSPLPTDYDVVEDWARAIDPGGNPADPGPLLSALIETGCCRPGDSLHRGFKTRVTETLGVVASTSPAVDCELELLERKVPVVPAQIRELISGALDFVRPDGEELVTAMQAVACACELACGFHYKWIFPHNVFPRDEQLVMDWIGTRREWHKELRLKLKAGDEYLDSPQLCEYAAQRALDLRPKHKGLPEWSSTTYKDWHGIKGSVQPESIAVRIDPFLAEDAARWALEHRGIVWYQHAAFGEWVAEISGLPLFGGGKDAKRSLLGDPQHGIVGERGDRSVICSIKAHGTGTNGLQFRFAEQLFGTNPAAPDAWEQTLGRLHRAGQPADRVRAWFYMHTAELRRHVKSALHAAYYVEGTGMGSTQKLELGFPIDIEDKLHDDDNEP